MHCVSPLSDQIELACLIEATARKPGNVHPTASFADLTYDHFVAAAKASAGPLSEATRQGMGPAIRSAVQASRDATGTNVNLGIALLIAPMAAVSPDVPLAAGIAGILNQTTIDDAEEVYTAIRIAKPGGLGKAASQDVHDKPTVSLREAMSLAADRDRIAEQYVTDFNFVLRFARHWLVEAWDWCQDLKSIIPQLDNMLHLPGLVPWEAAVIRLHVRMLADAPDSLVARKCGAEVAAELHRRAGELHHLDWPARISSWPVYHEFDRWLRADGNRRNPGATADLIAATIFAAIRDGLIEPPSRDEVLDHAANLRRSAAKGIG